ncbi:DUF7489 domain-containing protein [Streptomyces sp. NBC_01601]|uniref:DUF7489 domain-containing protein n=1 Tax=Streptomyces sp. NBC_01601 TaxID=2975892 RepID=UPI002E2DEE2F|nr:hypothetical protein [Streptomyces sp. NBC_01601]
MFKSRKPGQDDAWEGVVTDKSRGMLDGANMYHFVELRLSDGRSTKVRIGRRLFKEVAVGDRLVKRPGADPVKG